MDMAAKTLLLRGAIALAICIALYLLYRSFSHFTLEEVSQSIGAIPVERFGAALGFAAASYLCLSGFDALAVRYVGKPLPYRQTLLASFCGLSIGHNVGIAALSSGAVRYRFYSRWGLKAEDIAKLIVFCGLTVALGLLTLAGICLLLQPEAGRQVGLSEMVSSGLGVALLAVSTAYLLAAVLLRGSVRLRKWNVDLPVWKIALAQIVLGTINFACVAACLHQLLSAFGEPAYLTVASAYVTGNLAALVSHVPGGLGVLEATILYVLPGAGAIGALVAFRVVYFFMPLAIGLPLFLASEAYFRMRQPEENDKAPRSHEAMAPN